MQNGSSLFKGEKKNPTNQNLTLTSAAQVNVVFNCRHKLLVEIKVERAFEI